MLNKQIIFIITILVTYAVNIPARSIADDEEYVDYAQVISVEPMYKTVRIARPTRECWNEEVEYRQDEGSPVSAIVGGVAGGVLGHQFGHGSGKAATTMVGTLLGAVVGRDLSRESERTVITDERHCETVDRYTEEERLDGYRVTYRYKGKTLVTHTEREPGDTIPVRIAIEPLP